jgi:hypothetical protein
MAEGAAHHRRSLAGIAVRARPMGKMQLVCLASWF